nr:nitronate monooxygenase [Actinomycetota bacterium]NIV90030.1 nitronate monooxygenase [Actinomycetota bacterium]NIW32252.1 nitronate monooxygenase [Actinomycetota bacterium]
MTSPDRIDTPLTEALGIDVPLICGAMYPCSNPELIAAVSAAGGIGIVQPICMMYVHGHDLREGLRLIQGITDKPIGFNALVEKTSKVYEDRMKKWVDIALEEGVRFFITALGNPGWVVEKVHAVGGTVYHDVTGRVHAKKAIDEGVDGLICVNSRAGGHAGEKT